MDDGIALEDRRTIPPSDDEEEEIKREEERRRTREEDNGTPVLFESEMGDSGNDQHGQMMVSLPNHGQPFGSEYAAKDVKSHAINPNLNSDRTTTCNNHNNNEIWIKTEPNAEMKEDGCLEESKEMVRKKMRLSVSGRRSLSRRRNSDVENEPKEETVQGE